MTPVVPLSTSQFSLIPGYTFHERKSSFTRGHSLRKSTKTIVCDQGFVLPPFPLIRTCILHRKSIFEVRSTVGTDLPLEQQDSPVKDAGSDESNEPSSVKSKRQRPARKSEMRPLKNEDLVPGATFMGKIRSIQPFGAFVDFGAFTDGLIHVSRLSDNFVKDVASVVSVGQEVKVRLVEANTETGRISLTMRESDEVAKPKDGYFDKARPSRRNSQRSNQKRDEVKKVSKFVKGQDLEGTVKNLTRAGAFISLPEGEEGFLPIAEEADEGFGSLMGGSSLEVGQEVKVRVLRISRGQVTLTMKKEDDFGALDQNLSQGNVHTATNPFLLAFRKNKEIGAFLEEREKEAVILNENSVKLRVDEKPELDSSSEKKISDSLELVGEVQSIEEQTVEKSNILTPEESELSTGQVPEAATETLESDELKSDEGAKTEVAELKSSETGSSYPLVTDEEVESDQDKTISTVGEAELESPDVEGQISYSSLVQEENIEINHGAKDSTSSETQTDNPLKEGQISSIALDTDEKVEVKSLETESSSPLVTDEEVEVDQDESASTVGEAELESPNVEVESSLSSPVQEANVEINNSENDSITSEKQAEMLLEESKISSVLTTTGEIDYDITDTNGQAESPSSPESTELGENDSITSETQIKTLLEESEIPSVAPVTDEKLELDSDENSNITSSNGQAEAPLSPEMVDENKLSEVVDNQHDDEERKDEVLVQMPHAVSKNSSVFVEEINVQLSPAIANSNGQSSEPTPETGNSNGHSPATSPLESTTKATVSPALVKQLREETGAGMMDCKKALSESGRDIVKALEYLRKKGLASADKRASRATAEGRIGSYIHDTRIGVLIEVNCETDFVSRGDIFKELVDDLAMQVAACPQVQYLVTEDVPKKIVDKEREIEMQKEDLLSKPEQIRLKIVDGRINKRLEELALLEQPYIKNDKVAVKDFVKQTIATVGENIKVKRFVRFNLGEGLEKKSQDFAAEVAAQTSAKAVAKTEKGQPAAVEAQPTESKPSMVSAAMVKQLREETGAGMMDCKKALAETGGDLEKAQEYLRKKGLSTADKKSSRLAAEGRVGTYIHDSRIGTLIEVNCETDFVGRSDRFKELVDDLAMQVVACPKVEHVSIEDVPEPVVRKEKELESQREDILSKPEGIREKIVEGRVTKRLGELALLEQPFIKNDSVLVKDLVKQTIAAIGENIKVRRFVRFTLGEESDKKSEAEA